MSSQATSRSLRSTFIVAAAVLLALVATLLSPLAAHAAVQLSGTVVGPTGAAQAGINVKVVDAESGAEVASTTASASGAFSFSLAPDEYTLKFPATATTFAQYLGGTSVLDNAQQLSLVGGSGDKSAIKATLAASGTLTGTVRTIARTAISGATVTVYVAKDAKWAVVRTTTTSSTGAYAIKGLEPGTYRVQVRKGTTYAPVFSGGAASILAASDIGVLAGKTTTANFKLGAPAKVSGVVRAGMGANNQPVAGVKVTAWRFVGAASPSAKVEQLAVTATTNAAGAYTLVGLPPGDYTLFFQPPTTSSLGSTFYGGADTPADALSFVVGSGAAVTGRNISLVEGGTISGEYRRGNAAGPALANVRVSLFGDGEDGDDPLVVPRAVVFTQQDGTFEFTNIGPGDYDVVFGAFEKSAPDENIDFARRPWGTINLGEGEHETGVSPFTLPRDPFAPITGGEPDIIYSGYLTGKVGGWAELTIGTWNTSGYSVTGGYRWYRDGVLIPGETEYQYAFRPGDVGHKISGEVWRTDWAIGSGSHRTGQTAAVIDGPAPTLIGSLPSITGSPLVGRTLSVNPGVWEVIDASGELAGADLGILWDYTWQRSVNGTTWTDLETAPTHTVTAADLVNGPYLRVHMHGERHGYDDIEHDIVAVAYVLTGEFQQVKAPKVTATTTLFKADPGVMTPAPTSTQYQWRVYDASNTPGIPITTQNLSRAGLAGKKVTLTITYDADQVEQKVVEILVQKGKAPTATGSLAVTGTPRVGEMLTAPALSWSLTPDSMIYQWQYLSGTKWRNIVGASSSTYTPTSAYLSKRLRVVQAAVTAGYVNGSRISTPTALVATGLAPSPTTPASFTTAPAANVVAVVDPGTTAPASTSVAHVWKSGPSVSGPWTTIAGATGATYKVPFSLLDKWVQVTVTYKRTGHASSTQVLVAPVMKGVLVNTVKPLVSGPNAGFYQVTNPGTWSPGQDGIQYLWQVQAADETWVDYGSTDSHDANFGLYSPIDVTVTASKLDWADGVIRVPVKDGTFQYNSDADIMTSTARVGSKVEGQLPDLYNAPVASVKSPQWEYEKTPGVWAAIPGATAIDYTPTATYLGKTIRLRVHVTYARYTPSDSFSPTRVVQLGDVPAPGSGADAPTFSGEPKVGAKLTVALGTWNIPGLAFTYQWQSQPTSGDPWTNIPGATTGSYTPDLARLGHELRLLVTASKLGHPSETWDLYPTPSTIAEGQIAPIKQPVVTRVGSKLTVSTGTWNITGVSFAYSWLRVLPDSSVQAIANTPSYTLTADDIGTKVYVEVTASKTDYVPGTAVVVGQAGPKLEPTSSIVISGDRVVGQMLTVSEPTWNSGLAVATRQWLRNGVAISGATGTTYTTVAADLGKTISVRTTATAAGYPSYVGVVSAGLIVAAAPPVNTVAPVVTVVGGGEARVEKTVSTTAGTWSVSGLTFGYQWYRGATKITGATSTTYVLSAADLGFEISARVTASKAGLQSVVASSQVASVLTGAAPVGSIPSISVAAGAFKASAVTWSLPVTVTHQWQVSPNGVTWTDVDGGTSDTLPTSTVLAGWQVRVVVTGTRPGHADGVTTSVALTT